MERVKIPKAALKYFRLTGSMGGKARAERYSTDQLREWGKMGGRPRKQQANKKGDN